MAGSSAPPLTLAWPVPLWEPFAETIYWWTATEAGEDDAFIIVFHGNTLTEPKTRTLGSRGFRAVKALPGRPAAP